VAKKVVPVRRVVREEIRSAIRDVAGWLAPIVLPVDVNPEAMARAVELVRGVVREEIRSALQEHGGVRRAPRKSAEGKPKAESSGLYRAGIVAFASSLPPDGRPWTASELYEGMRASEWASSVPPSVLSLGRLLSSVTELERGKGNGGRCVYRRAGWSPEKAADVGVVFRALSGAMGAWLADGYDPAKKPGDIDKLYKLARRLIPRGHEYRYTLDGFGDTLRDNS